MGEEPTATPADLEWADGIAFGTPTRFGNAAARLKMSLDEARQLWEQGKLINKVATRVHLLANGARRAGVDDPRLNITPYHGMVTHPERAGARG